MNRETQHTERRGLPGGPNEMFSYTTGVFSTEGFRMDSPDVNNYQNIIPSGSITMKERDGSPLRKGPLLGVDNLGNQQVMYPGYDYQFPGAEVTETLMAKMGGALLDKTIKCGNCGWEWKAADGGSDLYNCHKCKGGKGVVKAQYGKEFKLKDERDDAIIRKDKISNFQPKISTPLTAKQKEQIRVQKLIEKQGDIKSYTPQSSASRISEITLNPLTAFGYAARNEFLPENFSKGERNSLDMATDIINPAFYLNQGKEAIQNTGSAVSNVVQGNYPAAYRDIKNVGINTLNILPLATEYQTIAKGAGRLGRALGTEEGLVNNLSKSKTLNQVKASLVGIPPESALPRLSSEELKIYRQVQDIGRMRATGKPISEQFKYALDQNIPEEHLQQIFNKSKLQIESIIPNAQEAEAFRLANPIRDRINLERPPRRNSLSDQMIDIINNSAPQQSRSDVIRHTLSGSDYENDMSHLLQNLRNNEEIDYYLSQIPPIAEEFILNTGSNRRRILLPGQRSQRSERTLRESFNAKNADAQRDIYNATQSTKNKIIAGSQNYPFYEGPILENVPSLSLSGSGSLKNVSNKVTDQSVSGINSGDVFTGSLNTSHSSYLPQLKQVFKYEEGTPQFLGYKPMNSMGFLSDYNYTPKDIGKYLNTEIDTQISRGIIPKDIQRPFVKGKSVLLPHYGIKQFLEGGEPIVQTAATSPTEPNPVTQYVVKKGDTLGKIAAANNTSVASIMKNNESIADANVISINQKINLATQSPDAPKEEVYRNWDTIRNKKDQINKLSDEQKIIRYYNDKPEEKYLIVDKKNAIMKLYTGGNFTKSFEVGIGQNAGDAQTVTKVKDGKTDWTAGNKSTGAGIYTISNIDPASKEYYNLPAFNLKNENGIEVATTIHGTPLSRRSKFSNGTVVDNRMSNGCINGKCEDLKDLYNELDVDAKVYILPEDTGNNFQIIDGKPALRVSVQNRQKYNSYVDQAGIKQKGQGANQTTNTLVYKPIKATLDEAKFKEDVFQWNDFNDEKEYTNTTKPFIVGLTTNKKEVMKAAKISSDVYNELAKMSFGIYGTESNFGDTHSAVGNLARATNKFLDPKSSSSPDYESKASTYGADEESRSVGLTQLRWNYLNKDEKNALKEVGITSNKDFLDPKKAAVGTVTVLGVRYNQQLNDKQKQDVWKYLPTKWNNRSNYSARVKSNSSYLSFKQLDKKEIGGESKPGPLMQAYNTMAMQKKMGGAITNKKEFGGQLNSGNITMYKDYIKGNIGNEEQAVKNYDKLNRIYYSKAKELGMTAANYVMTYVVGNS